MSRDDLLFVLLQNRTQASVIPRKWLPGVEMPSVAICRLVPDARRLDIRQVTRCLPQHVDRCYFSIDLVACLVYPTLTWNTEKSITPCSPCFFSG